MRYLWDLCHFLISCLSRLLLIWIFILWISSVKRELKQLKIDYHFKNCWNVLLFKRWKRSELESKLKSPRSFLISNVLRSFWSERISAELNRKTLFFFLDKFMALMILGFCWHHQSTNCNGPKGRKIRRKSHIKIIIIVKTRQLSWKQRRREIS